MGSTPFPHQWFMLRLVSEKVVWFGFHWEIEQWHSRLMLVCNQSFLSSPLYRRVTADLTYSLKGEYVSFCSLWGLWWGPWSSQVLHRTKVPFVLSTPKRKNPTATLHIWPTLRELRNEPDNQTSWYWTKFHVLYSAASHSTRRSCWYQTLLAIADVNTIHILAIFLILGVLLTVLGGSNTTTSATISPADDTTRHQEVGTITTSMLYDSTTIGRLAHTTDRLLKNWPITLFKAQDLPLSRQFLALGAKADILRSVSSKHELVKTYKQESLTQKWLDKWIKNNRVLKATHVSARARSVKIVSTPENHDVHVYSTKHRYMHLAEQQGKTYTLKITMYPTSHGGRNPPPTKRALVSEAEAHTHKQPQVTTAGKNSKKRCWK